MDKPVFKLPEFATDARVSVVMTDCTKCGAMLPESQTTRGGPDGMLLFVQCPQCKTVFIQDYAQFGS